MIAGGARLDSTLEHLRWATGAETSRGHTQPDHDTGGGPMSDERSHEFTRGLYGWITHTEGEPLVGSSGWLLALGAGAEVCAFALLAEQAEELDRIGVGGAEPVRYAGVELGRFAG